MYSTYEDSAYDRLRDQIRSLKLEQQEVQEARAKLREYEAAALLEQQQRYESHLLSAEQKVVDLQEQLRANNERAAKTRQAYEKDKRKLTAEVERLEKELHSAQASRAGEMERLRGEYEGRLGEMSGRLREAEATVEEARAVFEAKKRKEVQNVEEWCEGELQALKHRLGQWTLFLAMQQYLQSRTLPLIHWHGDAAVQFCFILQPAR